MAKKFFFVCGGILMLVFAYTLGADSVIAQSGEVSVVGIAMHGNVAVVLTSEGDVYKGTGNDLDNWTFRANVFEAAASE